MHYGPAFLGLRVGKRESRAAGGVGRILFMTLGRENIDRGDDLEVVWRGHLALVPPQEGIPCHPDPPAHQVKGCSRCFANAK